MENTLTVNEDDLRGRTILIVDDEPRNTFALTSYLEQLELNIYSTEDGFGAIDLLSKHPEIEIVLMDMMMPEMDGYETIQRIKGKKETAHIPIIAVTAKAMKGDREKCLGAGAAEYVSKPVRISELLEKMGALLHGYDR